MKVAIEIGNYKTVIRQLENRLEGFAAKADQAVQGAGIDCEAGAKQRCPVDTGRLRSSIKYTMVDQHSCTVGTNVNYAKPIEFGHVTKSGSHVSAQAFLFPSYLDARKKLIEELKNIKP